MRTRGPIGPLVVVLASVVALRAARRRLDVVEVRGKSMAPTLLPGDRLLLVRLPRPPRVGEIVVAPDPRDPRRELVKRVARVGEDGVTLVGDDPTRSTDGRTFGDVPSDAVRWRVVARYAPLRRASVLGRRGAPAIGWEPVSS